MNIALTALNRADSTGSFGGVLFGKMWYNRKSVYHSVALSTSTVSFASAF